MVVLNNQQIHRSELIALLQHGLKALHLEVAFAGQNKLIDYVELLLKWNQVYNLTAIRNPLMMVTRHVLDSLSINPYLVGSRILDLGSGAGLPGIPLAVLNPHYQFVLLDSNGKKTSFLIQVKQILSLRNVAVVNRRTEEFVTEKGFDSIVARAFSSLKNITAGCAHLLRQPGGEILAMKGSYPQAELEELPANVTLRHVHSLQVPGLSAERHLVCLACPSGAQSGG